MRVGILSAINHAESKIDWGGSPVEAYAKFLSSTGVDFDFKGYEVVQGQLPASPDECDAYVITGSPRGAYDSDPWIGELMQFVRDGYQAGRKFVGICFGHQVIAQALGGHVQKAEVGWGLGVKTQTISQVKPWMNGTPAQISLYFAHQDQVQRLPESADLLGGNEFCPIGMYAIADQVLGIQGHPEFTESHMRDVLKQQRLNGRMAEADTAEESLHKRVVDGQLVAEWIVNFLQMQN